MMYVVLYSIFALFLFCIYLTIKFRNPYKLIMVFGKKGSGKTTFLTKTALKAMRKGKKVYSTVDIPGAYKFDVNLIGTYTFPVNSVILIDEVGMIWDNRNFKNFRSEVRDYFKLQRQYRNTVYLFSQSFDVDVKLRTLTDCMYLCKCYLGWFSVARRIKRDITIVNPSGESEARIADSLEFEPIIFTLFGMKTAIFTLIPFWTKYFKSYDPKPLPFVEGSYCEPPEGIKIKSRKEKIPKKNGVCLRNLKPKPFRGPKARHRVQDSRSRAVANPQTSPLSEEADQAAQSATDM